MIWKPKRHQQSQSHCHLPVLSCPYTTPAVCVDSSIEFILLTYVVSYLLCLDPWLYTNYSPLVYWILKYLSWSASIDYRPPYQTTIAVYTLRLVINSNRMESDTMMVCLLYQLGSINSGICIFMQSMCCSLLLYYQCWNPGNILGLYQFHLAVSVGLN